MRDLQDDFRGEGAPGRILRDAGRSHGTIGPITPCEHRAEHTDKPQPWSHLEEAEALDKLLGICTRLATVYNANLYLRILVLLNQNESE